MVSTEFLLLGLLSESYTSSGILTALTGTVLLRAAFGLGGFFGGVVFLTVINGDMSKLVELQK